VLALIYFEQLPDLNSCQIYKNEAIIVVIIYYCFNY